ncbi:glycine/D-amino acid oxidase [Mycolicibacterium phlei]|uniref:FAD-dependent oxidoreductase n=1 Tax=Mycolicibacterium phlei DSM 43239 = CCUG 21000 TaxID=1226750 RepID=A0A5N5UY00_MYCPH|nr:FAD-dependent oxidoreductase [Mycolicibacterium phlei]VEG07112.1 glycine/D-amino acid oxidase [Mycobacteroides chelonae]AMO58980.1 Gamma-glutamylputrescine oxidoreductase [Mycolicibacterium phlei]EID09476.1 glycine/D-amino acid oxidase [Mycolicibacterium phlei RIVM601174]KAB7754491.1 FAD-dependent oxidoreductase [Mycolicibacterium phlei DSM 43239 = CCUG 21000]KXW60019.1 FAD-dependent oxidoreductase [Mycolicibacterium phlei DSM 43070]
MSTTNGHVSHWLAKLPSPRPALPGDRDADVCIVGAGYTGLWTAYYLKKADPALRITVLEARFAGFGASGRNGGWLSGLVPGDRHRMAARYGRDKVLAWQRALNEAVDEVIAVADAEGIDAGIVKGGTLQIARNAAQAARLTAEADEEQAWQNDGIVRLSKDEVLQRVRLNGVVSGYHTPHCARIQPAWLARGLADVVERLGVDIYEMTRAQTIESGRVTTDRGVVRAPVVLRATEGFTPHLPGLRRRWLPMNSSMIATEPLPADLWDEIGWQDRATMGDTAHGFFYAQRTVDDRIAIGGRSVPYRFGSRTDVDGKVPTRTIKHLTRVLHSILPQVRHIPIAHGWCGVLAVPRDWESTVTFDRATGLGYAGGYVGHGVTATNLAARTLTDLVLDRGGPLVELPWVGHRSRDWEPEPLRWLGVRGMYLAYKAADWHESRGRATTSPIAVVADKIAGRPH